MDTVRAADYHELARVSEPRVSPDGEQVAFVRTVPDGEEEYEATIHVVPVGGGQPRQFTVAEGVDAEPRWSPSGDRLAFVSTRGDDDDRPQLWVLPTDGGEARQLTEVVGGISELTWNPDGTAIACLQSSTAEDRENDRDLAVDPEYEPEPDDPRVIDRTIYRAGERYTYNRHSHVYLVDPENGEIERLTAGERDHFSPEFGDAGTLYYARNPDVSDPDDTVRVEILARELDTDRETVVTETNAWAPSLAATTDGRIAYPYAPAEQMTLSQTQLHVYDRNSGTEHVVTDSIDRTLAMLPPQWAPDEIHLYWAVPDEGSTVLYRRAIPSPGHTEGEPTPGADEPTPVFGDAGTIDGFDVGTDVLAAVQSDWDHPGDLVATTPAGAERTRLTRVNDGYLSERAIAQPEELWYTVEPEDGETIECQGWLLTPPEFDPDEEYPLIAEVHGGPHAMWTTAGTMWHEFQTLAARGYVVFWSNPRGSTGYGEEHMSAIEADWGPVTLRDVLAGVDTVLEHDYIDADAQFVTGGSFGGFMTAWAVTHTDRFEAAVSQRGVYDLDTFYGTSDAYRLAEDDFDALPWENPERYREHSPVEYAHEVETPTLLVHSEDDYRTPIPMAEQFYRVLCKQGVDSRFVRYPREGHELSRSGEPAHVVDRIERIARWFDGYSPHHDADPALQRPRDDGLTAAEEADEAEKDGSSTE
jgi:dipeptidyl aminopeptidase/acylaminoacyl peptidase